MTPDFDAAVIGAGVIGLAAARSLAAHGRSVIVLERHERFGVETSSRNSEVVHAGIYYPPGSLKATLCARGNRSLYEWCEARGVPYRRLGKVIVATSEHEDARLAEIEARARANGVTSLERITTRELAELEPHVRATAALWSPDTGIVDSHALMASLLADAGTHGAAVAWRHHLEGIEAVDGGYRLGVVDGSGERTALGVRAVVNAAGLESDRVAELAGLDVDACGYRLHYARGHYFRVHPRRAHLVRHLVYPTPAEAGLGIHVTLDLAGGVRLGPDVEYLAAREQAYCVDASLAAKFHAAVSRYLVGLEPADLAPDLAGIRPKLQPPGGGFRDFVIREERERGLPGFVNLIGIESPGLTCALEIGALAAELAEGAS